MRRQYRDDYLDDAEIEIQNDDEIEELARNTAQLHQNTQNIGSTTSAHQSILDRLRHSVTSAIIGVNSQNDYVNQNINNRKITCCRVTVIMILLVLLIFLIYYFIDRE